MTIQWALPRQILITILIIGGIAAYPLFHWYNREIVMAAIAGASLATVNILLGFAALEYSREKSTFIFMNVVLGGMGLRLLLLSCLLALVLAAVPMNIGALLWSLGLFYVVFLVEEILYILKSIQNKQQR